MTDPLVVHLDDLRSALDVELGTVEQAWGSDVELTNDHYWHLPVGAASDLTAEPDGLTVGRLSDDLDFQHYAVAEPESVCKTDAATDPLAASTSNSRGRDGSSVTPMA